MNCFDLLNKTIDDDLWVSGILYVGLHLEYHDNGQLHEKSYWKNGNMHGERLMYYSNGQLHEKSYWKDGEKITEEEYRKSLPIIDA